MKTRSGAVLAMWFSTIVGLASTLGQQHIGPDLPPPSDMAWTECWGERGNTVRSAVLESPDATLRAMAEVEARATHDKPETKEVETQCLGTARLKVSQREGAAMEIVLTQQPDSMRPGNSLILVDWSQDSRYVLGQLIRSYWSHGSTNHIVLFDAHSRTARLLDLDPILGRGLRAKCSAYGRVLGFTPDSQIVFRADPPSDEIDEGENGPFCVKRESEFLIDPATGELKRLARGFRLTKYGRLISK